MKYYYKNISDLDFEEITILNYSSGDKNRVEIIKNKQLGNNDPKKNTWVLD